MEEKALGSEIEEGALEGPQRIGVSGIEESGEGWDADASLNQGLKMEQGGNTGGGGGGFRPQNVAELVQSLSTAPPTTENWQGKVRILTTRGHLPSYFWTCC